MGVFTYSGEIMKNTYWSLPQLLHKRPETGDFLGDKRVFCPKELPLGGSWMGLVTGKNRPH